MSELAAEYYARCPGVHEITDLPPLLRGAPQLLLGRNAEFGDGTSVATHFRRRVAPAEAFILDQTCLAVLGNEISSVAHPEYEMLRGLPPQRGSHYTLEEYADEVIVPYVHGRYYHQELGTRAYVEALSGDEIPPTLEARIAREYSQYSSSEELARAFLLERAVSPDGTTGAHFTALYGLVGSDADGNPLTLTPRYAGAPVLIDELNSMHLDVL